MRRSSTHYAGMGFVDLEINGLAITIRASQESAGEDCTIWVSGNEFDDDGGAPPDRNVIELRNGYTGGLTQSFPRLAGTTAYGGLIDCSGMLWIVNRVGTQGLVRFNTLSGTHASGQNPLSISESYGIGIDADGRVWNSRWSDRQISWISPNPVVITNSDPSFPGGIGSGNPLRGVAVTPADNHVWVAESENAGSSVLRLRRNANNTVTVLETIELGADGRAPTGLAVDHFGNVWVTCRDGDSGPTGTVKRIRPSATPPNPPSAVDTVFNQPPFELELKFPGYQTYSYSDQTGQVTLHTTATGTWSAVHDSGRVKAGWHRAHWNNGAANPNLTVALRAADSEAGLAASPYVELLDEWNVVVATEDTPFHRLYGVQGRFLEIRVRLHGACPPGTSSPQLDEVTVHRATGDTNCSGGIDFFDIDAFTAALFDPVLYANTYPQCDIHFADMNDDGSITFFDIDPFLVAIFPVPPCGE